MKKKGKYILLGGLLVTGFSALVPTQEVSAEPIPRCEVAQSYHKKCFYGVALFSDARDMWIEYRGYAGYIYNRTLGRHTNHFDGILRKQNPSGPHYAPLNVKKDLETSYE